MVTCVILMEAALRLKSTFALLSAAAAGSALVFTGGANAAQPDSATGGGQIVFSSEGGPGDTIAFTAKGTPEAGTGQVQYVKRSNEDGSQTVQHGEVTCLRVDGTTAFIEGVWRDGGEFGLFVQDNGEGANASEPDIVAITPVNPDDCGDEADEDNMTALGRGNAQVRDGS